MSYNFICTIDAYKIISGATHEKICIAYSFSVLALSQNSTLNLHKPTTTYQISEKGLFLYSAFTVPCTPERLLWWDVGQWWGCDLASLRVTLSPQLARLSLSHWSLFAQHTVHADFCAFSGAIFSVCHRMYCPLEFLPFCVVVLGK